MFRTHVDLIPRFAASLISSDYQVYTRIPWCRIKGLASEFQGNLHLKKERHARFTMVSLKSDQ